MSLTRKQSGEFQIIDRDRPASQREDDDVLLLTRDEEDAARHHLAAREDDDDVKSRAEAYKKEAARNADVLILLNKIGERLIRYEKGYNGFQAHIKSSDEMLTALKGQVEQRAQIEKALLVRQEKLEKTQAAQMEKLTRAELLAEKLEETISRQNRLYRRLEKMHHDRTRLLRQMEHIEDRITTTQEALESKAMVLLTEKQIANRAPVGAGLRSPFKDKNAAQDVGFWSKPNRIRAGMIAALLTTAALTGVLVYEMRPLGTQAPVMQEQVAVAARSGTPASSDSNPALSGETLLEATDEDLLAAFSENPQDLAAALNELEPSAAPVPEEIDEVAQETVPEVQNKTVPVSFTPAAAPVDDLDSIEDFVRRSHDDRPLSKRMKADPALPSVIKEIEKKAFEGVPEAQHDLAAIYTAGHGGVIVDYAKAAEWFSEAAYNGVANARYNLGVLYHQGMGVRQNTDIAINWYKAAAALDHPEALYNLGIAYIEGVGTDYNPAKAAGYFEKAAAYGIMEAAYNLGLIHENGLLGDAQPKEALFWYKLAADRGSEDAKTALGQLTGALDLTSDTLDDTILTTVSIKKFALLDKQLAEKETVVKRANAAKSVPPPAISAKQDDEVISAVPRLSAADMEGPYDQEGAQSAQNVMDVQTRVSRIQEYLINAGLYPGPANGVLDQQTEDAIRSYQRRHNLDVTGVATPDLLDYIERNAASE